MAAPLLRRPEPLSLSLHRFGLDQADRTEGQRPSNHTGISRDRDQLWSGRSLPCRYSIGPAVVSLGIGALTLLSKSKKYFVGITWADGDKKGGFVMQCDKNDYRGVLLGLEGVTGKKGRRRGCYDGQELTTGAVSAQHLIWFTQH